MNTLIAQIHAYITNHDLIPPGSKIIIGLSGGPDSVFLLHALLPFHQDKKCTLIAIHLDHQWRQDSYKDVEFCKELTGPLGIQLVTAKISELSHTVKYNGSQEEMGRLMRRHFFELILRQENASKIALAHHADDQQETFFIRLLRGASLTGLTGMRPRADDYIRPLLHITKQEILAHLHEHTISYLVDPTNNSNSYLRNKIRNKLLPEFKSLDNRFEKNFEKTLQRLQDTEKFLNQLTQNTYNSLVEPNQGALYITDFLALDKIIQQRILIEWLCEHQVPFPVSESFLNEIVRFFNNNKSNQHTLHHAWHIVKKENKAFITQSKSDLNFTRKNQ